MLTAPPASLARVRAAALERLAWARGAADGILAAVPDKHLFARAGGRGNHAAWVMGHLAVTDDFCVGLMTGEPHLLDASFHQRFAGGSTVSDDPRDHPSRQELADAMAAARRRVVAWYEALDDAAAMQRAPEFIEPLFPDALTMPFALGAHEMFHAGQVAAVRAALGLPRVMA